MTGKFAIGVVFFLDQLNPWDISSVEELCVNVSDEEPNFVFSDPGFPNHHPLLVWLP